MRCPPRSPFPPLPPWPAVTPLKAKPPAPRCPRCRQFHHDLPGRAQADTSAFAAADAVKAQGTAALAAVATGTAADGDASRASGGQIPRESRARV